MLAANGLGFSYPGAPQLFAGINFQIHAGESVAVVGRNGAGKSTLFRLLNGLLRPTAGCIQWDGKDTRDAPAHLLSRTIGSVFQSPETQLFEPRVLDEVEFGPRQLGLSRAECKERAETALSRTGLLAFIKTHPLDLDRASRRFVALACVLAMRPRVLLLDEPQQGLDFQSVELLETILREERRSGTTIVFISHDIDFVARNAERLLVIADGSLVGTGSPLSILGNENCVQRAGLENLAALTISRALSLPVALTPDQLVAAWKDRLGKKN